MVRPGLVLGVALALGGCGRIGFDATGRGPDADPFAPDADPDKPDADPNAPDARPAVCGDMTCAGNQGESCQTCAECATAAAVCGNGICNAGEDTASCFDDCGPVWNDTWITYETQVLAVINNARQLIYDCPGMPNLDDSAELTPDAGLTALARNMAWDLSHHDYLVPASTGLRCSGQDMPTLMADAGYVGPRGYAYEYGFTDPSTDGMAMLMDTVVCPMLKRATYFSVGVGRADDVGPPITVVTIY